MAFAPVVFIALTMIASMIMLTPELIVTIAIILVWYGVAIYLMRN